MAKIKLYTMVEAAGMNKVTKSAIFYRIKIKKLGKLIDGVIKLSMAEINSLHFRDSNKVPYPRKKKTKHKAR